MIKILEGSVVTNCARWTNYIIHPAVLNYCTTVSKFLPWMCQRL